MYEYHAWVAIYDGDCAGDCGGDCDCDRYGECFCDCDDRATRRAGELVEAKIAEQGERPGFVDLRWVNAMLQLHMAGYTNHRSSDVDDALALFGYIAEITSGSYGLFHAMNDEDPVHHNDFRVGVMRRGAITWMTDANLSPAIPVIHDP